MSDFVIKTDKERAELFKSAKQVHETSKAAGVELTQEQIQEFNNKMDAIDAYDRKKADDQSRNDRLAQIEASMKESNGRISPVQPVQIHEDEQRFSLTRAISSMIENQKLAGLEKEVSDEIALKCGKKPRGFWFPHGIGVNGAAAAIGREKYGNLDKTNGAGALVTTQDFANFIEYLRNQTLMGRLGARMLGDLVGSVSIPKKTGTATTYWINADGSSSITPSNQAIGQVPLAPNTVGASTKYTRAFVNQTSLDVENFVRQDLFDTIAVEIDRVGFNGSGVGSEPEGILQNSDITNIVALGTDGDVPNWSMAVNLETLVAAGNGNSDASSYVFTPHARGKMKTTLKSSGVAGYIWENDEVNDHAAYATNQLPHNLTKGAYGTGLSAGIFGYFPDALYGYWSGLDVIVNPFTADLAGAVSVTVLQDVDFTIRHTESFSIVKDIKTV